jgi:UPF0271 protein
MDNDALLMPFLGSCNIACGGHCGDDASMLRTLSLAKRHGVKAGAHPSYPDWVNFGRSRMEIGKDDLKNSLLFQIKSFQIHCKQLNVPMHHIKPHGALYNFAAENEGTAILIVDLLLEHFHDTILYCPPQSVIADLANLKGLPIQREVFADRGYQDDLSLLPRQHPNALLTDVAAVLQHVESIVNQQSIKTISGMLIPIQAETLCVHGDNPNAYDILKSIVSEYEV